MTIVLTLIALCFKVKPTRALEGGLKLGIALTGISAIIGILTTAFSDAMASFVERTGISFKYYRCWLGTFGHHHLGISLHPLLSFNYGDCQCHYVNSK